MPRVPDLRISTTKDRTSGKSAMQLRFLGTGNARRVPVYGCDCRACLRAHADPLYQRQACSALLEKDGYRLMIDAGRTDLCETFPPGTLDGIILTHYHMDHVMGLFHLRWGMGHTLPVFGPDDPKGSDDLYKHPGILDFRPGLAPFKTVRLGPFRVTPVPLNHSRITLGYLFEADGQRIAYLTDTAGLPPDTLALLQRKTTDVLVLDCSTPPLSQAQRQPTINHNDLSLALSLIEQIEPAQAYLTHVGHQLDEYWLDHPDLPPAVCSARDGLTVRMGIEPMGGFVPGPGGEHRGL